METRVKLSIYLKLGFMKSWLKITQIKTKEIVKCKRRISWEPVDLHSHIDGTVSLH